MDDLTPHQQAVLTIIRLFQFEHRYSPSLRNLCSILRLRSINSVNKTILALVEKKYIEKSPIGTIMFPREGLNQAYFDSFLV